MQMLGQVLSDLKDHADPMQLLLNQTEYAYLYALSPIQQNLLSWYRFDPNADLLHIGSGCGVLTALFCEVVASVTAVEADEISREIMEIINQEANNLQIRATIDQLQSMDDQKQYDYVVISGLAGTESEARDLLSNAAAHLKKDGVLMIAMDNKYALKFMGIPKDPGQKLLHFEQVRKLLQEFGYDQPAIYYPYPDYKLPLQIFSEQRQPRSDEILRTPSYECISYDVISETALAMEHIQDGTYQQAANSYLMICGDKPSMIYAKYNSQRAPKYAVATIIEETGGIKQVRKHPQSPEALLQCRQIAEGEKVLSKALQSVGLARFTMENHDLVFPYIEGSSLVDESCFTGSPEEVTEYLMKVTEPLFSYDIQARRPFEMTDGFLEMFGKIDIPENTVSVSPVNIDSIVSNFVKTSDSVVCIDYEWTVDFPVPLDYVRFRCFYYLYRQSEVLQTINEDNYLSLLGFTKEDTARYLLMEEGFQQMVHGKDRKYIYLPQYEKRCITKADIIWMDEAVRNLQQTARDQDALIRMKDEQLRHPLKRVTDKLRRK